MTKGQVKTVQTIARQYGLPKPIAEYKFHPTRRWRVDYFFEHKGKRVALEVEGGIWGYGRHNRATGFIKDMEKYNALAVQGIFLLRVQPQDLFKVSIYEQLQQIFKYE